MTEITGGPQRRVELHHLPALGPGLPGEHGQKPVHRLSVLEMCLTSCLLRPPVTRRQSKAKPGSRGSTLHRCLAIPTEVRSRRASSASPRSVSVYRSQPSTVIETASSSSSSLVITWESLVRSTPSIPDMWERLIQGQSYNTSRARFSAGLSTAGSR